MRGSGRPRRFLLRAPRLDQGPDDLEQRLAVERLEQEARRTGALGAHHRRQVDEMVSGDLPEDGVDAHNVQIYYTMLLAKEAGMTLGCDLGDDEVTFTAE